MRFKVYFWEPYSFGSFRFQWWKIKLATANSFLGCIIQDLGSSLLFGQTVAFVSFLFFANKLIWNQQLNTIHRFIWVFGQTVFLQQSSWNLLKRWQWRWFCVSLPSRIVLLRCRLKWNPICSQNVTYWTLNGTSFHVWHYWYFKTYWSTEIWDSVIVLQSM